MTHNNTQHTGLGRLEIESGLGMFLVGKQVNHFHSAGILEESRDGQSDTLHCSGAVSLGAPGHQMIVTSTNIQRWILTKHLLK